MPPRVKFGKETVINAAFAIVRFSGWDALSARAIAQELGASVGPIYTHLNSMENIKDEVTRRSYDLLYDYCTTVRTKQPAVDRSLGYLIFAKKEKHLSKCFYDERFTPFRNKYGKQFWYRMNPLIYGDKLYKGLNREQILQIRIRMLMFIHGMFVMINNGSYPFETDEESLAELIRSTGKMVMEGLKAQLGKDQYSDD